jgi:hypothetical protein
MEKPYAVVFAGVPGTSKSPLSHYISCEFGLPILNTDQIRFEVREDFRIKDIREQGGIGEFQRRLQDRFSRLLASKVPFIFDGSMDRHWAERKQSFQQAGYDCFMIDMELSREFLIGFYNATNRGSWADTNLDFYLGQHNDFMAKFAGDVNLRIDDDSFADRLKIAADGLRMFLSSRKISQI